MALQLLGTSSYDDDEDTTKADQEEVGIMKNPYAAWEWASSLRAAGMYQDAARIHQLTSSTFETLGDHARSVISQLDAGIDLAAASPANKGPRTTSNSDTNSASVILTKAIDMTTTVEGKDVALLQRVIAKEGEARIALASLLWDAGSRQAAETQLGTACLRLEQLEADAANRQSTTTSTTATTSTTSASTTSSFPTTDAEKSGLDRLKFSIDDGPGAFDISCSKFRSESFLTNTLQWPESLQQKVFKLQNLSL
jgi:hypothetical protein